MEEQRIRLHVSDPAALADSLDALRQKYGIDPESLLEQLDHRPADWLELLRELKRGT